MDILFTSLSSTFFCIKYKLIEGKERENKNNKYLKRPNDEGEK